MTKKYMTVNEVQECLGLSKNTTYKLIQKKGFPVIRIGKQYRIPADKFEEWLNNHIRKQVQL